MKILLVDDEMMSSMEKQRFFTSKGLSCDTATTKKEITNLIAFNHYDCFFISLPLDKKNDFALIECIRQASNCSIIYYGKTEADTRKDIPDKKAAFIGHHYTFLSQWQRIKKKIALGIDYSAFITNSTLTIDRIENAAYISKKKVDLTPLQFNILVFMALNQNRILSMDELYRAVWQTPEENPLETVQVNISRLRRKLQKAEPRYEFITTIRSQGYRFNNPPR